MNLTMNLWVIVLLSDGTLILGIALGWWLGGKWREYHEMKRRRHIDDAAWEEARQYWRDFDKRH